MNRWIDTNGWIDQKIKNGLHTFTLLSGMLLLVSMLGWFFAGMTGVVWVLVVTAVSLLAAPGLSLQLILRWYKARPLEPRQVPSLYANLRELTRRAQLPNMPILIYVPTPKPCAFTTGSRLLVRHSISDHGTDTGHDIAIGTFANPGVRCRSGCRRTHR